MAKRLKVLLLSPYPIEEAGNQTNGFLLGLAAALRRLGHHALLAAPTTEASRAQRATEELLAGTANWGQELVVTGASAAATPFLLPSARSRAELCQALFSALEPDVLHLVDPFPGSVAAAALRSSPLLTVITPSPAFLKSPFVLRGDDGYLARADGATAPFAALLERLPGPPSRPQAVVPPAVPLWAPPAPLRRNQLLFVEEGRFARRALLRAVRKAGLQGSRPEVVVAAPEPLGIGPTRLRRIPFGSQAEREAGSSAVVVITGEEGLPYALAGLAGGAVVVAPEVPLYVELLAGGQRGLLYPPADPAGLLSAVGEALEGRASSKAAAAAAWARGLSWERTAAAAERFYLRLLSRRKPLLAPPPGKAQIEIDLHMHTNHSHDCATPVETLLATALEVGLHGIAVTDHNEISGALQAAALAPRYGIEVIVGEEVKTAAEGEVIGLFLRERIPPGLTLLETIEAIKDQGGIVYVPHPFDRLHSVPDYRHLLAVVEHLDGIEVYNARVAFAAYNAEAARFAAKYRLPGGAGSDAHVPQGLGSARVRLPAFTTPAQFLRSLANGTVVAKPRSLLYVQALKFLQTTVGTAGRPAAG